MNKWIYWGEKNNPRKKQQPKPSAGQRITDKGRELLNAGQETAAEQSRKTKAAKGNYPKHCLWHKKGKNLADEGIIFELVSHGSQMWAIWKDDQGLWWCCKHDHGGSLKEEDPEKIPVKECPWHAGNEDNMARYETEIIERRKGKKILGYWLKWQRSHGTWYCCHYDHEELLGD